ncbi:MAG TPA: LapA family protein [Woeseiaceae bacterium]|nr:LapA family protein [Woeseiaceae bacterium]
MLKKAALILLLIVIFGIMVVFSYLNTGEVEVNLAFASVTTSVSIAFTVTLVAGWLLGVISMGLYALRLVNERRILRRALRTSESEVSSLRSLPLSDAD